MPMPTLLARSTMDSQFTMPMLLDTPIMLESLLELTMVMDVFLGMVPLETEDILHLDTMDMPTMESMATMESVTLILMPNPMPMPTLLARSTMDSQFIMPMLLDTLIMLESLPELTMVMDMFLDMVPLETVDILDTDMVM